MLVWDENLRLVTAIISSHHMVETETVCKPTLAKRQPLYMLIHLMVCVEKNKTLPLIGTNNET